MSVNEDSLTAEELKTIGGLRRLASRWPRSLMLACKEIAALIDRLVPTLPASASSAERAEADSQIPPDDPWAVR